MGRASVCAALFAVAIVWASGCRRDASSDKPDAGPAVPAKVARSAAAAGEKLVDVDKSKVVLTVIKDRDQTSPVRANLALRDGAISLSAGTARMTVDLNTFDSSIPVRNERVRTIFFETGTTGWDAAELSVGKLPDAALAQLRAGKNVTGAMVEGNLKVHGKTVPVSMKLDAGFGANGELWIKSATPVEVKISAFELTDNLKRLSSICMHDSIDDVVRVDVSIEFPPG